MAPRLGSPCIRVWQCTGVSAEPAWWRGDPPPEDIPSGWAFPNELIRGQHAGRLENPGQFRGLYGLGFFRAQISDVEIGLNDAHLSAGWSEFDRCHFRQRVRPITNEHGFAAQGSFGNQPTIYRHCTFERIRFKGLGGFSMGAARFENCTFLNCRWDGHFAHKAHLVECTFIGRMNGCVWFGRDDDLGGDRQLRQNVNQNNDFTQTVFTANVAWRHDFPVNDQRWPGGFTPLVDD